jgi:hypothetical protein
VQVGPARLPHLFSHAMPAGFVQVGEVRFVLGIEDAKLVVTTQHQVWGQVAERPEARVGPLKRTCGMMSVMPPSCSMRMKAVGAKRYMVSSI